MQAVGVFLISAIVFTGVFIPKHCLAFLRCSLDGSRVQPLYEVLILQQDKSIRTFSSVLSARIWLRGNGTPLSVLVTDERTGEKIEAERAFYVESEIVTTPHTGNRIHVFRERASAESHARKFNGRLVDNPFTPQEEETEEIAEQGPYSNHGPDLLSHTPQKPLSLQGEFVLERGLDPIYISENYSARLYSGFPTPPYKPPWHFV